MDANSKGAAGKPPFCFNPRARDGRELLRYRFTFTAPCFNPRARDGRELTKDDVLDLPPFQSTRP